MKNKKNYTALDGDRYTDNTGKDNLRPIKRRKITGDEPKQEGMRKHYGTYGDGSPTVNYKWLKRFLRKNVGKKWDDIYSEITKLVNKSHSEFYHYLGREVEKNTWEEHHKVYDSQGYELHDKDYYVDFRGCLSQYKRIKTRYTYPSAKYKVLRTKFGSFVKINDIWYKVEIVAPYITYKYPEMFKSAKYAYAKYNNKVVKDVILGVYELPVMELWRNYGELIMCVSKKQAGKSDIKRLKKLQQGD